MSKTLLPLDLTIEDILDADSYETGQIINKAITDMVQDTFSKYKEQNAKRAVTIEFSIARLGQDGIYVDAKVTPKPAPYSKRPETKAETAPGQMSIDDMEA